MLSQLYQLYEDLASWRGELKKAAIGVVRSHYNLFPPEDSQLSKAETRVYVKKKVDSLIKKSAFAHGEKDDDVFTHLHDTKSLSHRFQGHTMNFGHKALREVLYVFLFSRENRIGNQRPAEFGARIPNNTLTLAVTAVSHITLLVSS